MPILPPQLTEEIVNQCAPYFRLQGDRDARLTIPLSDWPGYDDIIWSGSGREFTARLVRFLPADRLQAVLRALRQTDNLDEAQVAAWCAAIDAAQGLLGGAAANPLAEYHRFLAERWSKPRYQLDSRFVQLTLLLDQGPDATDLRFRPDGQRGRYDSLARLLADVPERALVLLGRPGCGKTTLLRRLQLENAWAELAQATGQTSLFVSLNGYRGPRPGSSPPPPLEWLRAEWQAAYPQLPDFDTLFWQGRCLLLLDGLNEMPHRDDADYQERVGAWQAFWQRHAHLGNSVLFSCRSLDYSAPLTSEQAPVRQVQVEPLSPAQCERFVYAYLPEQADRVWAALQPDRAQLELFATPFFLQLLVEQVAETGEMPAGQAGLLTGFVRRALWREVAERRQRLFAPGALLSRNDVQQVLHRAWGGRYDLPAEGPLLPALARLAHDMQSGRASPERSQVRLPAADVRRLLARPGADDLIAAGMELNVLDKALDRQEIAFYHQLLQEYFAARVLAAAPAPARVAVPWRAAEVQPPLAGLLRSLDVSTPLPPAPATGWEETMVLAAAMSADPAGFVTQLLPANLPLAARCAASPEVAVPPELVERLQTALLARIAEPQADLRARIAAAEALGELGDPRFPRVSGPHGDYLRPPVAAIPGGTYTIGDDDSGYARERPAHQVAVAPFAMAVFPVTNAEYAFFMAAGGYEEERWWTTEAARAWRQNEGGDEGQKQSFRDVHEMLQAISDQQLQENPSFTPEDVEVYLWLKGLDSAGLETWLDERFPAGEAYRQPEFWDDSRFSHPAQPVVGVSWYEAQAYCAWLAAQTGQAYRLPTEVEWEAAARGQAGRAYAYGRAYDAAHGNTFESHIRRTTPVGVYPGGQTPEGIADLSGNVWEWTTTLWGESLRQPDFPYPYRPGDGRENLEDSRARRVLRDGSWSLVADYARAAYRYGYSPAHRGDYGFRLVVVGGGGASSPIS